MNDVLAAEILRVGYWLFAKRLSFSIDKTCYMIVAKGEVVEKELSLWGKII